MRKIVIDKRKSVLLVMTCILFMMTYSSLLGTPSFSRKLSVFVDENNLSHEDIRDLIVKINQIESVNNRRLTQELKKIGKRKEKEKGKQKDSLFLLFKKNQNTVFYKNSDKIPKNIGNISAFLMKKDENNLRTRE
ncbi:hypothetical protein [Leptotrichia trevisanii]|uniref:hypothetical protein n=1 Tax=Leptotrichia trevisanii TaxID=109328 RepID=UPI0026EC6142|nr:hypothetical protein [Leptotrichia trevisanii]